MRLESKIQQMCVRWFRLQYPSIANLLFSVPNGGYRNALEAAALKREGLVAGVADLILLYRTKDYGALCIEMKTDQKTSKQSPSQKEWQKLAEYGGARYVVCRNFQEFAQEVNLYLRHE